MSLIHTKAAVVIGGGPAGLMAAEILLDQGVGVDLYDGMPAVARKLVVAGQSNLSLTRSQPFDLLISQYGDRAENLRPFLSRFTSDDLRSWAAELGVETFVGSTGHVFPSGMTSDTLLSQWLQRLQGNGLRIHSRHYWQGWDENGNLCFLSESGGVTVAAPVVVLALGGGSWPQLGSTGDWVKILQEKGVKVNPLQPANCGFDADFSSYFSEHFHGKPVKNVVLKISAGEGGGFQQRGEFIVTATGFEGSLLYACGRQLREKLTEKGEAIVYLDLCPDRSEEQIISSLSTPRGKRSTASHLRKTIAIDGAKAGLLNEYVPRDDFTVPEKLARWIKKLPVPLKGTRPLAEAISSGGGVCFSSLDEHLMLRELPGTFCAGEMLDWEAPTGGYLLTACFATGRAAGFGAVHWLEGDHDRLC